MLLSRGFRPAWRRGIIGLGVLLCIVAGPMVGQSLAAETEPLKGMPRPTPTPVSIKLFENAGTTEGQRKAFEQMRQRRREALEKFGAHTARPIFVVGTLLAYDPTSQTVRVKLEPNDTGLPHSLTTRAERAGIASQIRERELVPEREFKLLKTTDLWDARPDPNKPQTSASSGKIAQDKQRLKIDDFKMGDRVGALYRRNTDDSLQLLAFSKVDPNQQRFSVDFDPLRGRRLTRNKPLDGVSTQTLRERRVKALENWRKSQSGLKGKPQLPMPGAEDVVGKQQPQAAPSAAAPGAAAPGAAAPGAAAPKPAKPATVIAVTPAPPAASTPTPAPGG